jgi:uncharacterized protein (TIGR02391 family)
VPTLIEGVTAERAREVVLERVDDVERCRAYSAGPGPDHHLNFASHYLKWVENTEAHFRRLFRGDDWLNELHTRRWEQIVSIGAATQRPVALIDVEIDHQAARLRSLAETLASQPTPQEPVPMPPDNNAYVHAVEDLHPAITDASARLFENGHYSEAILKAFIAVEVAVRDRTGLDLGGSSLMNQAMGTSTPALKMTTEDGQTGEDEQKGMRSLFAGAMMGIRNPKAHGLIVQDDPARTFEYLAFASLLMRRLDDATGG